jgi:hypothetical protein
VTKGSGDDLTDDAAVEHVPDCFILLYFHCCMWSLEWALTGTPRRRGEILRGYATTMVTVRNGLPRAGNWGGQGLSLSFPGDLINPGSEVSLLLRALEESQAVRLRS